MGLYVIKALSIVRGRRQDVSGRAVAYITFVFSILICLLFLFVCFVRRSFQPTFIFNKLKSYRVVPLDGSHAPRHVPHNSQLG